MAASLPVVATDVGDVRTVLPPEQARYLVPPGPEAAAGLARGIADLARDPAARERLGAANRRRVEESFTFAGMCADYREVYHSALRAK
jgi:L-malate glycosyltransferase